MSVKTAVLYKLGFLIERSVVQACTKTISVCEGSWNRTIDPQVVHGYSVKNQKYNVFYSLSDTTLPSRKRCLIKNNNANGMRSN